MDFPVNVVFRNVTVIASVKESIEQRVQELGRYYSGIVLARIAIERPHRHHVKGNPYHVTIALSVPGEDIVVTHEPQLAADLRRSEVEETTKSSEIHPEEKHLDVALSDALDRARRRLEDHARKQRGQVKVHEEHDRGRIARLFPDEGYGFIETMDGGEMYFHRNSLLEGKFERLVVGTNVSFVEESGDKGPQASSVRVIG